MSELRVTSYNIIDSFRYMDPVLAKTLYRVWKGLNTLEKSMPMENSVSLKVEQAVGVTVPVFVYATFFDALTHQEDQHEEKELKGKPYYEMIFEKEEVRINLE
jgi:hypothetical protein